MDELNNNQIICISPHYWNGLIWFRKQHFISRFHKKGYKVAYIDPSFSMVRKSDISERRYYKNSVFKIKIEEIDKDLFIIKPPQYLPFHTRPLVDKLNYFYIFSRISFVLKKLKFENFILLLYKAEHVNILKYFNYRSLVFDITDDLPALEAHNKRKYEYIKKCTESLAQKSNIVLVTSHKLLERYKQYAKNIHLIPNGYDSNLFSRINHISYIPSEMKNILNPIIGFVGTLFSYLDYDLLKYIIEKNKDKTFVFVGPCCENVKKIWEEIIQYKNVIWLGKKKKTLIPAIISRFDVCINPFKMNDVSKSVSPLKVYEYLALKKPIVSVEMESLGKEKVGKLIYFARDYKEFNEKINLALKNIIPESEYQCVEEYSWDNIFKKVFNLVD